MTTIAFHTLFLMRKLNFRNFPATEYLEYGKDHYWDSNKMVQHILKIVLPIFEVAYPHG